jgi:hypothetical protein
MTVEADAVELLLTRGADTMAHPGGTLSAHLRRVRDRLAGWGASQDVVLAGLCHASYGTDGFPTPLLDAGDRDRLAAVIGRPAEALVYLYCCCDRGFSYPTLAESDGSFLDRFSGEKFVPTLSVRRNFVEITVANELDIAAVSAEFRDEYGFALLAMFTRLRALMSGPAWRDCQEILSSPARR